MTDSTIYQQPGDEESAVELFRMDRPRWAEAERTEGIEAHDGTFGAVFFRVVRGGDFTLVVHQNVFINDGLKEFSPVRSEIQWHRQSELASSRGALEAVGNVFYKTATTLHPVETGVNK